MYEQEEIKPYDNNGEKSKQVEHMFDHIAHTYDLLNHRLSWGIDKGWRRKAVRQLESMHPSSILDIATGTGDFAILSAKTLKPKRLVGADISEGMMQIGRQKVKDMGLDDIITFQREDCMSLTFPDNTFDAVTSAFGIRNFSSLDQGLAEICRVLKPGGRLSIVELTRPVSFPMRQLFTIYSHTILPFYGRMVSRDNKAYDYLTATLEVFPQAEEMMKIFRKAGFSECSFKRLTFGICTMYYAIK